MPLRLGLMRHKLELQELQSVTQDDGGVVSGWVTVAQPYAQIMPLSGRELLQAQAVDSRVSHRITMRYRDGVTPKHRILARGRTFNIVAVATAGERDRELWIQAEERTS